VLVLIISESVDSVESSDVTLLASSSLARPACAASAFSGCEIAWGLDEADGLMGRVLLLLLLVPGAVTEAADGPDGTCAPSANRRLPALAGAALAMEEDPATGLTASSGLAITGSTDVLVRDTCGPLSRRFIPLWKEGGIITGVGDPAPTGTESFSIDGCAGDGECPSTWKPTT